MRTIPVEMLLATAVALVAARVAGAQELEVAGGATLVAQTTSDDRIRREVVGSADLFLDLHLGPATVHVYVEAGSSPSRGGVSQLLGEANTDAGTALDARRRGRLQISEAKLLLPLGKRATLTGGLLDATGYLDVSRIANDENLFFLGVPFVNNPTIEFPDYALGVVLERPAAPSGGLGLSGLLTSSYGLADNPGSRTPGSLTSARRARGCSQEPHSGGAHPRDGFLSELGRRRRDTPASMDDAPAPPTSASSVLRDGPGEPIACRFGAAWPTPTCTWQPTMPD